MDLLQVWCQDYLANIASSIIMISLLALIDQVISCLVWLQHVRAIFYKPTLMLVEASLICGYKTECFIVKISPY